MSRPIELKPFYDGWADQQQKLLDSIRPLTAEQMQLRPAPTEWAIWQLASNMAGGRLYWLCFVLKQDDLGLSHDWCGWEDKERQPAADNLVGALTRTRQVVDACLDRWSLQDLATEVTTKDWWGNPITISPAWAINRLLAHEYHHGSEIATILRIHNLPTAIAL
jgi:uncharacterized damage-inducible protein DinB